MNQPMSFANQILKLVDLFVRHTGAAPTDVVRAVSGDQALLNRLAQHAPRPKTANLILGRFARIWPDDLRWPAGIERPAPIPLPVGAKTPRARPDVHLCPTCGWPMKVNRSPMVCDAPSPKRSVAAPASTSGSQPIWSPEDIQNG